MIELERLLFDYSRPGRKGWSLPELDVPETPIEEILPEDSLRRENDLPEISEVDTVRHYHRLSVLNHHVDKGFYPLGSCTMKYNPKINEDLCRLPGFTSLHPLQPAKTVQGALKLMYDLAEYLAEIGGLDAVSLQPAAGAHGELTGIMMIRKYFDQKGENRTKVLVPDSAHGTNPATVTLSGFQPVAFASNEKGQIDPAALDQALDESFACFMITNPNTLGIFEKDIRAISEIAHRKGALLYMDGANLNACLGYARPGDVGFDCVHFNLHKTFATPHGGGGPGSGPVGVKKILEPFLPIPIVAKRSPPPGPQPPAPEYFLDYDRPDSVGKVLAFFGNFGVMIRAYVYIRMLGAPGLKEVAECSVLNANYIRAALQGQYGLKYSDHCMHEVVLDGTPFREYGIKTLDIAKRMLDYGVHAPTVYFPLIVPEALMIEPTETESKESLDAFIEIMNRIAQEARENPQLLHDAPTRTPVQRLDEAKASRELDVSYRGRGLRPRPRREEGVQGELAHLLRSAEGGGPVR
jgi:glycine dehydrogenase subunit 2